MRGRVICWSGGRISFDPHLWHATEKWSGTRLVLAAYSISQADLLNFEEKRRLDSMKFLLPGSKKRGADHLDAREGQPEVEDLPHDQIASGCDGPPMVGDFAGSVDEFVDGFGRCSPGRWRPSNRERRLPARALDFAGSLREKVKKFVVDSIPDLARATFRLATGRPFLSGGIGRSTRRLVLRASGSCESKGSDSSPAILPEGYGADFGNT